MSGVGKVKVLHLTFNMEIGGTEQVICQIVGSSDSERFEHEILCLDKVIGPLGRSLMSRGYYLFTGNRKPGLDFALIKFIHGKIVERKIFVLHCHQYTPFFYGALGALGTGVKVIFTEHGRFFPDRHHLKRRFINPLLALRTRHITAISEATADAVAEYEYLPRNRIRIVYNGIRDLSDTSWNRADLLAKLNLSPKHRYIGTVARLEPIKNQAMMVKAYKAVKAQHPETRLVLIGDGAEKANLEQLVASLKLEGDVIFTGFIDDPQIYINIFEIFLLSSFSEGTSMTLLEAMSLSKPSVVTEVGGNVEIVSDGETGIVVPSNDDKAFADAIVSLLENPNTANRLGVRAREKFERNFTASVMTDCYQDLYLD